MTMVRTQKHGEGKTIYITLPSEYRLSSYVVMALIQVNPQGIEPERLAAEKTAIAAYFHEATNKGDCAITTLLWQVLQVLPKGDHSSGMKFEIGTRRCFQRHQRYNAFRSPLWLRIRPRRALWHQVRFVSHNSCFIAHVLEGSAFRLRLSSRSTLA